MKNSAMTAFLLASLSLAGCRDNLDKSAKAIESQLGIKVEIRTSNEDGCAVKQLSRWIGQYKDLRKGEQAQVRNAILLKAKTLVVHPTEITQKVSGELLTLALVRYNAYGPTYTVLASKILEDTVTKEGNDPMHTATFEEETLHLRTQSRFDRSSYETIGSRSLPLYDLINTPSDLERALSEYSAVVLGSIASGKKNDVECAAYLDLAEIL